MSVTSEAYLILDQGGSQSRALLFDQAGRRLAAAHRPVATRHPAAERVEQSPRQLSASLRRVANEALAAAPTGTRAIAAGIICQRSSLLAWDRLAARPLTPLLSWLDRRGAALLPSDPAILTALTRRSGLYPSAHHGASKCAWLLRHNPRVQAAAAAGRLLWLPLAAYLAATLCGRLALDPANAQRTLLWDHRQQRWSRTLAGHFGLELEQLPPLLPSLADWGALRCGGTTLPCRLLGGDQALAPLAAGAPDAGTVQINLGTGGFLCCALPPAPPPHRLLQSVAYSDAGQTHYWLEGTLNGVGAALSWAEQAGTVAPRADDGEPGLFLNAVGGLGAPDWRSDLTSHWLDAAGPRSLTAVEESILFLLQRNLEALQGCGASPRRLNLSGGISQRPQLAQRLADLSGLPVLRADDPEASARGAAWLLAGQPSAWQQASTQRFEPRPNPALQRRYQRWQQAMRAWLGHSHT